MKSKPDYAEAHINLGNVLKDQGKSEDAVVAYGKALELKPEYAKAHSNLLFCMNYDTQTSQREILAESRRWDAFMRCLAPRTNGPVPTTAMPNAGCASVMSLPTSASTR